MYYTGSTQIVPADANVERRWDAIVKVGELPWQAPFRVALRFQPIGTGRSGPMVLDESVPSFFVGRPTRTDGNET